MTVATLVIEPRSPELAGGENWPAAAVTSESGLVPDVPPCDMAQPITQDERMLEGGGVLRAMRSALAPNAEHPDEGFITPEQARGALLAAGVLGTILVSGLVLKRGYDYVTSDQNPQHVVTCDEGGDGIDFTTELVRGGERPTFSVEVPTVDGKGRVQPPKPGAVRKVIYFGIQASQKGDGLDPKTVKVYVKPTTTDVNKGVNYSTLFGDVVPQDVNPAAGYKPDLRWPVGPEANMSVDLSLPDGFNPNKPVNKIGVSATCALNQQVANN